MELDMKLFYFIFICIAILLVQGCAVKKVMKNCEKIGDSKYSLCNELGVFE